MDANKGYDGVGYVVWICIGIYRSLKLSGQLPIW